MPKSIAGVTSSWREEPSGLPRGGPPNWWISEKGVAQGGSPQRVREEVAALGHMRKHPACPRLVAHCESAWIVEPVEGPVEDPVAVVTSWRPDTMEARDTRIEEFLAGLGGHIAVHRALGHIGLSRSRIDRFLDQRVRVCSRRGPVVGGWGGRGRRGGRRRRPRRTRSRAGGGGCPRQGAGAPGRRPAPRAGRKQPVQPSRRGDGGPRRRGDDAGSASSHVAQ